MIKGLNDSFRLAFFLKVAKFRCKISASFLSIFGGLMNILRLRV